MDNSPFLHLSVTERDHLTFFHDVPTRNKDAIDGFLAWEKIAKLQASLRERTYIVLGGDGTFVEVAKYAHRDGVPLLGVNFWSKGFLLHDQKVLDQSDIEFEKQDYPILHADLSLWDERLHAHAFNEVYITRAWDTSIVRLSLTHRTKTIDPYQWDGIMISTPAGSTGWSRSYGWVILPHSANLNVITPVGKMLPRELQSLPIEDKWRIRIQNDTTRLAPLDILVDNKRMASMESRPFELVIERAERWVTLLIEKNYRGEWDKKPFREAGFI